MTGPRRSPFSLLPSRRDYAQLGRTWRGDIVAGVTVGIVALPLALAFGVSSGVGAAAGLVTAIVAGIVAGVFGGSNVQVSGPTGAMVVVLGPIVVSYGAGVVPLLSLMAGVIVVVVGAVRWGRLVTIIPWPVIEGFTFGIAVIIFLQQVPSALGVESGASSSAFLTAVEAVQNAEGEHLAWALAAVAAVALVMVLAPKIHRAIPGSLIAILLVTIVARLASLPLESIGSLPEGLPAPAIPSMTPELLAALAGPAFAIAALAAIESLLSARVAASLSDAGAYDADRELVGQGLASIASGFFGGMPATGAIARTAVNVRAGARSRLAAVTHALVLLAVVYLAAAWVSEIPLAALAGVLIVTAVRMVSIPTVSAVLGSSRSSAVVFVLTAIVTVAFDLIIAVGIGFAVAAIFALWTLSRSGTVSREALPGDPEPGDDRIALLRLDGALFFAGAEQLLETTGSIKGVTVVILRMSQLEMLDATGARVVSELMSTLERRGITVLVKGIQPEHLKLATRVGVLRALRHEKHLFDDLDAAIAHARSHVAREQSPTG